MQKSPKMGMLTLNKGEKMKNFLGAIALVLMSPLVFAGGQSMSDSQGNNMSSAKASSESTFMADSTLDMIVQLVIHLD